MRQSLKILILLLLTCALWLLAYSYHDIVATSLALACSVLLSYLFIFSIVQLNIYTPLKLDLTVLGGNNGRLLSQTALNARLTISELKIAPTFFAKVVLNWEHSGADLRPIVFKGLIPDEPIFSPILFPHRGIWRCEAALVSFSDPFGLLTLTRKVLLNTSITICPSGVDSDLRDVISSASRPGDVSQSTHEKSGDLFEMKQYDPAQGVRTILWRVFAKRGELMSRAPEAAVTPEGFTACYALIEPAHDILATKIIDYTARIQNAGVTVAFNCSGNKKSPVSAGQVEEALITSVWNPPNNNFAELTKLLDESRTFGEVTQMVVFVSLRTSSEQLTERLLATLSFLEAEKIKPILAVDIPNNYDFNNSSKITSIVTSQSYQILEL